MFTYLHDIWVCVFVCVCVALEHNLRSFLKLYYLNLLRQHHAGLLPFLVHLKLFEFLLKLKLVLICMIDVCASAYDTHLLGTWLGIALEGRREGGG